MFHDIYQKGQIIIHLGSIYSEINLTFLAETMHLFRVVEPFQTSVFLLLLCQKKTAVICSFPTTATLENRSSLRPCGTQIVYLKVVCLFQPICLEETRSFSSTISEYMTASLWCGMNSNLTRLGFTEISNGYYSYLAPVIRNNVTVGKHIKQIQ